MIDILLCKSPFTANLTNGIQLVNLDKMSQDMSTSIQSTESFGEKVRGLREGKQMPLRKLAALLDIDQSTLSKIERNERKPNDELIKRIADAFNVTCQELNLCYLSDKVAQELINEKSPQDILKAVEAKIIRFKKNKKPSNV